jgi:PAS domain-containing protein
MQAALLWRMIQHCVRSVDVETALGCVIHDICEPLGWPVAHVYLPDPDPVRPRRMTPSGIWHLDDPRRYGRLREATERTSFERDEGLIGRAWARGEPIWEHDIHEDPSFKRLRIEPHLTVRAAIAIPLVFHGRILAILEFFSEEAIEPDELLLGLFDELAWELGTLTEQKRIDTLLERSAAEYYRGLHEAPIPLLALDAGGTIRFWNRATVEVFGVGGQWAGRRVEDLLAERFELEVSVWTVGRYLKRWGLTPQKPLRRAYERDSEAVRRWLEEEDPAIQTRAKREGAAIHWGDEMGLRSDHQAGTSYGRKGQTPVVPGTGQRFGCNLISTITNRGTLRFMVFHQRFTAEVMIEFLRRLLRSVDRKVFLIVDGHPAHTARRVKRWVAQRSDRLELFFPPGYSPELNPDEVLNQGVKSNAVGRERPENKQQMMRQVRSYLRSTQRDPQIVRRYFLEDHVRYAADPSMFTTSCSP